MTITSAQLANMRDAAVQHILDNYGYGAIGSGTTTPTESDTTLTTETYRTTWQETTGPSAGVLTLSLRIPTTQANSTNIAEIGAFDAASSGNMANHSLTTVYAKTASKEVWIDFEFTVTASNA